MLEEDCGGAGVVAGIEGQGVACGWDGGDGAEGGQTCVGDEEFDEEESLLNSFSYASLRRLPSKSLFLAASISLLSFDCLRSVSACLSLVLTSPSSILVCSFWKDLGDTGT